MPLKTLMPETLMPPLGKKTPPESSGGVCKATEAAPHPNLYLYYPK